MKTAVIISEYNPFHNGHLYQVQALRQALGDVCIIAVMSGNFTQRGDCAIFPKFSRARAAVLSGVSLVLELPYPFCASSAEYFAQAGVSIAHKIGVVDYLCFGSESGNIDILQRISQRVTSEEFKHEFSEMSKDRKHANLGHAALLSELYDTLYPEKKDLSSLSRPNDILAIEYLNALSNLKSKIAPLPIKRQGAEHDSLFLPTDVGTHSNISSAGALRKIIYENNVSAIKEYLPHKAHKLLLECESEGNIANIERLQGAILAFFRLVDPLSLSNIAEITGGLNYRLCTAAAKATSLDEFFDIAHTKRYTRSRIRRTVLNCMLGITKTNLKSPPLYTQILAADKIGRQALRKMRKLSTIPILTKPASYKSLPAKARAQAEISVKADSLYSLSLDKRGRAADFILSAPFLSE